MPSRVKLLNAAGGGVTGTAFKIGMGAQPYSIRVVGASSNGVTIESSPDDGTTWQTEVGLFGGAGSDTALTQSLTGMVDGDIGIIQHYVKDIRAKTGVSTNPATVYLEMGR